MARKTGQIRLKIHAKSGSKNTPNPAQPQGPASGTRLEMTDRVDNKMNWGTQPVVSGAPVLSQGIYATASGGGKL